MPDRDSDIGMAKNSRATGAHLRNLPVRAGSNACRRATQQHRHDGRGELIGWSRCWKAG